MTIPDSDENNSSTNDFFIFYQCTLHMIILISSLCVILQMIWIVGDSLSFEYRTKMFNFLCILADLLIIIAQGTTIAWALCYHSNSMTSTPVITIVDVLAVLFIFGVVGPNLIPAFGHAWSYTGWLMRSVRGVKWRVGERCCRRGPNVRYQGRGGCIIWLPIVKGYGCICANPCGALLFIFVFMPIMLVISFGIFLISLSLIKQFLCLSYFIRLIYDKSTKRFPYYTSHCVEFWLKVIYEFMFTNKHDFHTIYINNSSTTSQIIANDDDNDDNNNCKEKVQLTCSNPMLIKLIAINYNSAPIVSDHYVRTKDLGNNKFQFYKLKKMQNTRHMNKLKQIYLYPHGTTTARFLARYEDNQSKSNLQRSPMTHVYNQIAAKKEHEQEHEDAHDDDDDYHNDEETELVVQVPTVYDELTFEILRERNANNGASEMASWNSFLCGILTDSICDGILHTVNEFSHCIRRCVRECRACTCRRIGGCLGELFTNTVYFVFLCFQFIFILLCNIAKTIKIIGHGLLVFYFIIIVSLNCDSPLNGIDVIVLIVNGICGVLLLFVFFYWFPYQVFDLHRYLTVIIPEEKKRIHHFRDVEHANSYYQAIISQYKHIVVGNAILYNIFGRDIAFLIEQFVGIGIDAMLIHDEDFVKWNPASQ